MQIFYNMIRTWGKKSAHRAALALLSAKDYLDFISKLDRCVTLDRKSQYFNSIPARVFRSLENYKKCSSFTTSTDGNASTYLSTLEFMQI